MKTLIALVFLILAGVVGWQDWQATIGEGFAFRPSSLGDWLADLAPATHATLTGWADAQDPGWLARAASGLLALPLVLVLFVLGTLFWLARRRRRPRPF